MVMVLETSRGWTSRTRKYKLDDRWRCPYRVREKAKDSTFYYLNELDGTQLKRRFAGDLVKKYFSRANMPQNPTTAEPQSVNEERPTVLDTIVVEMEGPATDHEVAEGFV